MRTVAILSVLFALTSAAEYTAADPPPPPPPSYAPEKAPIPPIPAPLLALIAKLLEALKVHEYAAPLPAVYDDAVLPEETYAEPDLLSALKLLLPVKPSYAPKTTYKILNRLPGLYGNVPPYAYPPLMNAAYAKPAPLGLGLIPAYAQNPANFVYPPAVPGYPLPLAPKLPLGPAGAYGYPAYGHLPESPLIVLTKELLDSLKADAYGAAPVPAAVEYTSKPKKHVAKAVVVAKKTPGYAKAVKIPAKPVPAKVYAAPVAVAPVPTVAKVNAYQDVLKVEAPVEVAKLGYSAKVVPVAAAVPADYAADAVVPAAVAPTYTPTVTPAPVDLYSGVEARSAIGGESQASTSSKKLASTGQPSTDGGESARAADHSISLKKTIS